eukprot:4231000-Amphidinium_carterae.1
MTATPQKVCQAAFTAEGEHGSEVEQDAVEQDALKDANIDTSTPPMKREHVQEVEDAFQGWHHAWLLGDPGGDAKRRAHPGCFCSDHRAGAVSA